MIKSMLTESHQNQAKEAEHPLNMTLQDKQQYNLQYKFYWSKF